MIEMAKEVLLKLVQESGFALLTWQEGVMLLVSFVLLFLAIVKKFEPLLLVPIAFGILQATRARISKTEYIACPGCGRTMYDLQGTLAKIKAATAHLKGLKIGVMGCIVNGPGEMADADYGYVGAARGKVSLYRQKECVEKNIPEDEAIERLLQLIDSDKAKR